MYMYMYDTDAMICCLELAACRCKKFLARVQLNATLFLHNRAQQKFKFSKPNNLKFSHWRPNLIESKAIRT